MRYIKCNYHKRSRSLPGTGKWVTQKSGHSKCDISTSLILFDKIQIGIIKSIINIVELFLVGWYILYCLTCTRNLSIKGCCYCHDFAVHTKAQWAGPARLQCYFAGLAWWVPETCRPGRARAGKYYSTLINRVATTHDLKAILFPPSSENTVRCIAV